MPFALTEYNGAAVLAFHTATERLTSVVEPALRMFDVREGEAVPTAHVRISASQVVELAPGHAEPLIQFDPRRVVAGDLAAVYEQVFSAARDLADARVAYMKANLDAVTDAAGQVHRVRRDMNWDDLMDIIERVQIGFNERDEPAFALWPPEAQARYDALAPRSDEQERRWRALMDQKRQEARARKRDRRLR